MRNLSLKKLVVVAVTLLISNVLFSNTHENKPNNNEYNSLSILSITGVNPTSGHAGTIVKITGSGFTTNSVILLGSTTIPTANIQFISSTEIDITLPCGLSSGNIIVDGIDSAILFTYSNPTISNILSNLSYCVGTTVPEIVLSGTPTNPTTTNGLLYSWTNSNTAIGLSSSSGTGNIPTFTCTNTTFEPITSTIIITPSINGCSGVPKNYTITINPKPISNPISNILTCAGASISSISLTASSPNSGTGTSFSWNGTNNSAIGLNTTSGLTSPIPSFTATNNTNSLISSTITVTPTYQGCVGNPINFNIDVTPVSLGGTLSGDASICSGTSSGLLSLSGYRGAILNWESSLTGSAPWTSIANTTSTFQSGGLTQTTYYRVAVQNSGCSTAYSNIVTITVNNTPSISGTLSSCIGSTSQLSGNLPASSNAWQSSNPSIATISNTGIVTGISAGTSIITFTNSNGCLTTVNFVVHPQPLVTTNNPAPVCNPNTVNLTLPVVTAGSSSNLTFSYFLDAGTTTPLTSPNSVSNIGTYYIKGTDGNGCFSVNSISVLINSLPAISVGGNNSICLNESTTLTATGATTYSWNGGVGSTASVTITPTATTTYTVNGTDNNGCIGTGTYTVNVKTLPIVNAGTDQNICAGSNVTLTATGSGFSSVTWNSAISDSVAFQPAATTTYTVTASGTNGCFNTDSVLVTVNALPTPPQINVIQPNCSLNTGSIQFSGLPTTGNWTINPGSYNGTGATFNLNSQSPGNYTFTVKDANQCVSSSSIAIINAAPITPAAPSIGTITPPTCANPTGSVTLSGLPTGSWTITKLPGGQTYSASGNTYTVTNLTAGTYTFTVSNGICSSSASSNVVINVAPSVTAPIVGLMIQPTCSVATGSVTLSGLPSGSWTITRFPGNVNLTSTGLSTTISGLNSGVYTFTVTDASGCISSNSSNVTIDTQPATPVAPIANAQSFLVSDNATVANLQIVSTGSPSWYSSATGGTVINSATLLSTGIYYASQTVNGCESSNRTGVNVSVFPNSIGGAVAGSTTVCLGTNSTTLTLSGYTGNIIKWQRSTIADFSANVTDITNQNATYTVTNLTTPFYFRAVVQSGTAPLEYSSPGFIDVNAQSVGGTLSSPSTSICRGESSGLLTLTGHVGTINRWEQSIDGGSNWAPITNTSTTYTSGPLTTTTQYRAIVQNGVCSEAPSSVVTITVKNTPIVTDIPNQEICFGETKAFGDAFIANHSYTWTSDLGYSSILPQVNLLFDQVVTQNYTYTITNDNTGCSAQDQFQIIVNPLPNPVVVPDASICVGNAIAIGGNSTIGSTYSWSSTPVGFISNNSNPTVNPVVTTTYTIEETVTATGCKKTNQVTITVQPEPVITILGAPQFNVCETTTQIQLQASITNHTTSSILWTKVVGSGTFDFTNIENPKYTPSLADISFGSVRLKLTVTGIGACSQTYSEEVVVIIDKKPIANAGLDVITCGTDPVQINATGTLYASNLVWTLPTGITGTLDQSNPYIPVFTPSANDQNYAGPIVIALTATSNTTCSSDADTVSVLITPAPKVDAGPPTVTICEGANYIVPTNSMAAQNIVNSSILWTNGTGDGTIVGANSLTPTYIPGPNDISNGSVTLTLSAAGNNPCSTPATDNIVINIVKNPIVNAGPDKTVCQGSINVNATIQNAGSILWTVQNGSGSFVDPTASSPIYIPSLSDLNTTVTFSVTVTPINNCGPTVSDSVLYTINATPNVIAGGNATICQSNSSYQLQATASNTTSITWTSTGSGSFDNIHNEDPIYTLSPGDILAGSVTFTLTGTQSGCSNVTDTMVLTIQKNPTANAGAALIICQGDMIDLPGNATNSSTYNWIRNGGAGTFINTNTTNPSYMSQPTESGTIYLTLIANAIAPCTVSASSNTTITIIPKATADAGNDAQICEGSSYQITTASASNNIGVQWTTNGDGTFTGGSTISPTYTPGPSDNNNGSVTLTLVATKNFPCNANAVDEMTLIINKIPTITVINPDVDLCVGDPSYIVTGVVPTNYNTLTWTSSGSGTFAPNNSVAEPTYFPSASDYTLGTVTLTLTAARNPLNCNSSTSNTITLHFITPPTADAGSANATICEGSSYVTIGTNATNYSNVTWATTGTGTFTNATTLTATYTPSAADFNLGYVDLTLNANPLTPCSAPATDVIRLFLQKLPVITLTATDAICVTENSYGIGGTTVTDYDTNSIVWTTSGTGTFSPSGNALNPVYNPSNADLASAAVTLTLTVNSIAPCIIPVSSTLVLSFQKVPVANAGPNLTRCAIPFQVTDGTADLTTVSNLVWSTSGTGTFDFTNIIDPIYTPSAADILNGSVRLTLTANPIAPCADPLVSFTDVTLIKLPLITVVSPQPTICEDETNVLVNGTNVQNAASYIWTSTTGTGTTISNATSLTPIVTPSLTDITNNYIDLTITAIPNAPCSTNETKIVRIPIQKKPSVSTGAAQTICEGNIITTTGALSSNVTNLTWNNNGGDGTFTTSNLNTITEYTPGPIEIANGSVSLTLTADAIAPCVGTVSATVQHLITKNPVITVNPTLVTICETDTYQVPLSQITVDNSSSIATVQWTTSDPSSLTGSTTFTPTYTPSPADITAGFANLVLTVTPISPCATPIVKTIRVNITKSATIDATQTNYTFCENTPKQLSAVFDHHNPATISWAIVSGSGTLSASNTATPIFTPDTSSETVIIEVNVNSNAPCTDVTTAQFTLNVIKKPIVTFATTTDVICNTQTSYALNGNTVSNVTASSTYMWTTTGTGTFASNTALVTTYNFSAADLLLNSVTLKLEAQSDGTCTLTDSEEIVITIKPAPIVTTAPNETICEGTVFTANATATNEISVLWTTGGTSNGTFTNANTETAQYTPGSNDINDFTLIFTAFGDPVCSAATATKTVVIQKLPVIDAGLENRNNCASEPFQITGVTGQHNGTITWTSNSSSGVNSGTFSNASILNPIYNPSAAEIAAGTPITLTITSQALAPCSGTVSDFIILNLTPTQAVNAGLNQTICENDTVNLVSSASNSSSYNWTTSGDGTFSDATSLTTNYIPGSADLLNGLVTLTLNATSNSTCPVASDSTIITIRKSPTANAGNPATICEGSNYTLSSGEATANHNTSITWTATGPGALDVSTINTLTPTYIPAAGQTGTVTLTLTATGYAECAQDAVSVKTITIVPSPFVSVISSKTICEGATLTISNTDASATNYSSLQWSSSNGLGTFTPANATATTYTPATGQTGNVTLSLTASSANGVCPNSVGNILLTIIPKPIVEAGTNGTICQNETYTITGASVQNESSFSWSVAGPAIIVPGTETTLNPEIDPINGATGTITVTLTAIGNGICPIAISDEVTIQINPTPIVDAGTDAFLCEGTGSYQLNGTAAASNTNVTYSWTTTGGGTIQTTANPLAPLYVPSASDFNTSNGINVITITLNATTTNGCSAANASMQLTLYAKPKITAGVDLVSCGNDYSVSLLGANVINNNSGYTITWGSSGNGTWDYSSSNGGINPTYIFGSNDTSSVTLTMSALPNSNCPQVAVTDAMTITINQKPTITATTNLISMCGETFTLPDLVTISNSNNLLWTNITGVSGTPGTLINATTETPTFTPSINEIANGFVLLKLTATSTNPSCTASATTTIRVNLQPKATIILEPAAQTNITACQGVNVILNNIIASIEDYSTFTWTENGTGSIVASTLNTLQPEYVPGPNETGVVTFTLQATNIAPCTGLVSQIITLTIAPQPTVNAGPDVTVCQNTPLALNTATTTNSNSIAWSSSQNSNGTSNPGYTGGSFSNINIINPIYTPSQDDVNLGYVYLTVRATSTSCNSLVTDVIKVTITPQITVAAGSNATICEGNAFTLAEASHTNAVGYTWTSSQNSNGTSIGTYITGSFNSNSILNPIYTPSLDDINLGYVYLTITGTGGTNCPLATSQMKLTIVKKPTVSTTDVQMCMNTPQISLNGNATNYQSINWSIYSGPGSISTNPLDPFNPTFTSGISGLNTVQTTVIRLYATPIVGCTQATAVYDDLVVTIQPLPSVEAGSNGALCYIPGEPILPFTITGTSVLNNSNQTWTSTGAGVFNIGTPVTYQSFSNICTTETLTLTANGIGACSTSTVSDALTLTLNCLPPNLGTVGGNAIVCQGTSSVVYTVPVNSNVLTYNWQVPTGATIISGQGTNAISVDYGDNAISGTISVNGVNGCGTGIASNLSVTVNQLPSATAITGPVTLCEGTNYTFTANTIPNVDAYIWTFSDGTSTTTTNTGINNSITFPATVSGNLTVQGFSNSCGLGDFSTNHSVTVEALPSLTSPLASIVCSDALFNYQPTTLIAGATFTWTRAANIAVISNPAANGTSVINETLFNLTNNSVPVNYQITTTTPSGCSKTETIVVTVKPIPSLTSATPVPAICSGATFNYTPQSAVTGAITWSRATLPGISEVGAAANGTISEILTNTTLNPITVRYVLTLPMLDGCSGPPQNIDVIVNPVPNVTPQSAQVLCEGDTFGINFVATNTGGTSTFNWVNTNGNIGLAASGSGSIPTFTLLNTTTTDQNVDISVTPIFTNGGISCTGPTQIFSLTVNPKADVNQPADQVVCNGSATTAINFTTTNSNGTTTYAWTNSNTSIGLGASGVGNIGAFTGTNTGTTSQVATIVVTPTYTSGGVSCTGPSKSFTITVNPSAQVNQPTATVVCANSPVSTIFNTTNTDGTTTYSWTNNNTAIGLNASGNGSIPTFTALNSGTTPVVATITVTPTYTNGGVSCVGTSKFYTITVNPGAQVNPITSFTKCTGDLVNTIALSTTNTIGTTSYSWTNSNPSIGLAAGGTGDISSFTATNLGTNIATATITVTPTFTHNAISCSGPVEVFTITVSPAADMIQPLPKVVCNSELTSVNFTTTNTPAGATTYSWSSDVAIGMPFLSGTGSIPNFTAINSGTTPIVATITVTPTYTNNGVNCTGLPKIFTITVNPSAEVNQPFTPLVVCNGTPTSVNFLTNNSGGTTEYSWTNNTPSIGIGTSGTGSIGTFPISNLGTAPLTANLTVSPTFTNAGKTCTGTNTTKLFSITINPTAQVNQPNSQVVCNGEAITPVVFTTLNTPSGTTTYSWTNDNPSIGLNTNGTADIVSFTATNTTTTPQIATIVVTPTYTNNGISCTGPSKTFTITVNPSTQVDQPVSEVVCNGSTTTAINFTTTNSNGTITYAWSNNNTSIGLGAAGIGNIGAFAGTNTGTNSQVATIVVTPTYTSGGVSCSGPSKTFTITVNPSAQVDQPVAEVVCNGSATTAINFTTTNSNGTTTYAWSNDNTSIGLGASGVGNIGAFAGTNTGTTSQVATIVVTPTYTSGGVSCTGPSKSFTITVNPSAQVNQPTAQVICSSDTYSLNFTTANTGGTTTYSWTNNNTAIGLTAASGNGSIPSFTAINSGLAPVVATFTVTPTYTNGGVSCVGSPTSFTLTINPRADVAQPASQEVCNGASTGSVTFSSLNISGTTTYNWTNSDTSIGLPISGTGPVIPSFNAVNTGNVPVVATITVTPTYTNAGVNCSGPSKTFTITVYPSAEVNQPAPQVVCNGTFTTLVNFSSNNLGGVTTYSWTNNNTTIGLASNGIGALPSFNAVNTGTTPVIATIEVTPIYTNGSQSCTGATKIFTITVNPSAEVVQPISTTLCNGENSSVINFTSINSVGTTTYTWTNTNVSIGLGANGSGTIPMFTAVNNGTAPITSTITVTPVFTNGGLNCLGSSLGSSKTFTITVNPSGQVNQPSSQELCNGATTTPINFNTVNSVGTTTYSWTNSNPSIGLLASGSGNIPGFTVVNSGATPQVATVVVTPTYTNNGISCTGPSKTFTITVNPTPTATVTGTNNFVVCQNGIEPQITFTASNGTAPYTFTYEVIRNGITGPTQTVTTIGANTSSTISFPTVNMGNYTINLLYVQDSSASLCNSTTIVLPNTAFVTVQEVGTIIPTNSALVSQTVCQNTPITPIVFTIGGSATNTYVTNLPNGLSGNYTSGTFTISGTPLVSGVFNYIVHTSGSNCNSTYSGTITVNSNDNIIALVPVNINQSVCNNTAIQPIIYNLGGGATGGIVTFSPSQPIGITWSILNNVITISGTSNSIGSFTYTVESFGICGQSTVTGNITINTSTTISLVAGDPNTTVCLGSSFALPIQYSITPASATMVVTGLPTGVTFDPTTGIISGTPTQSGTFPYSISSTTTCGNTLTGTITVNPLQSISYLSGNTNQVACQNTPVDPINFLLSSGITNVTITPALPAGINYSIASGILTVSGTPTVATSIASNYTITTQGSCGPSAIYSITFDIRPEATITLTSGSGSINQSVCQSSAIIPITFTIGGGATGIITPSTLPDGLTLSFDAPTGVYTIQGNPLVNGIFNFPITTTGCPKTLFITISNVNTAVGIVLTSPAGTDNQTICQSTFSSPIQPIIYNVIGATNIVASGLPPGVTAVFSPGTGQLIISGTPLVSGVYNYTVTSQPCSIVKAGVIRVSTPISITNEIVTNVSCSNENDGAISVTIVGGSPFIDPINGPLYAIRWTGPNGFQQNQTSITGLAAGTYVLTGTDAIGCPIPTMSYTVLPAQPIIISLVSSTNVSCNGVLGCANFDITGGSGIYTNFTLQFLDPSLETLVTLPPPANNNYFNICNLRAGLYYLTVEDSNNCSTIPYLFTIYDYSALSIENVTLDDELCQDTPGKIRIKVNSLDPNLTFYYNDVLVPSVDLGDNIYELSINAPTTPIGIVKVTNSQNCWKEIQISTTIITPDFEFTSNDFQNYGYYSVNESVQFTHLVDMTAIPAEYDFIVWDFGDNTPFKVFYNPEDLLPNSDGENFETVFHTYTTNGIYEITLTVYNRFGCSRKISKTIVIGSGATMMLPTIFTPNNDGINDYFRPSLLGIKDVAMQIYDNWGNLVYEIESEVALLEPNWGWNGIEKGQSEPINNNYRYYIMATTINDVKVQKEGRFLLVK